jgi:hypothetical protein
MLLTDSIFNVDLYKIAWFNSNNNNLKNTLLDYYECFVSEQ